MLINKEIPTSQQHQAAGGLTLGYCGCARIGIRTGGKYSKGLPATQCKSAIPCLPNVFLSANQSQAESTMAGGPKPDIANCAIF
ncbi:hypothetical protein [Arsukibacterium sp.]|uniref:hypothetical protein n=1 Tax=Arsukibacterium sp. TaxID=1977258 RepID=UPI001BD33085|nr:hypothetical protein [Arsukibacterium sp.]